jgi:hypothetical protein
VTFYDRDRDRATDMISQQPSPPVDRGLYHIDPHPQFSPQDTWVVHTTTVRDRVDVALTPVAGLVASARDG